MSNVLFFCLLAEKRKAWWRHALQNQNTWAWISSTYLWLFQNINIPVGTCLTFETYFHCPSAGKTREFQFEIRTMAPLKSLPAQVKIHGTVPLLEHVIGTWINIGLPSRQSSCKRVIAQWTMIGRILSSTESTFWKCVRVAMPLIPNPSWMRFHYQT